MSSHASSSLVSHVRSQTSRVTLRNSQTGEETVLNLSKEQEADESHYKEKETGAELEVIEKMPLLEFLANSYKKFGCQLEFITNKSQVGLHRRFSNHPEGRENGGTSFPPPCAPSQDC